MFLSVYPNQCCSSAGFHKVGYDRYLRGHEQFYYLSKNKDLMLQIFNNFQLQLYVLF